MRRLPQDGAARGQAGRLLRGDRGEAQGRVEEGRRGPHRRGSRGRPGRAGKLAAEALQRDRESQWTLAHKRGGSGEIAVQLVRRFLARIHPSPPRRWRPARPVQLQPIAPAGEAQHDQYSSSRSPRPARPSTTRCRSTPIAPAGDGQHDQYSSSRSPRPAWSRPRCLGAIRVLSSFHQPFPHPAVRLATGARAGVF